MNTHSGREYRISEEKPAGECYPKKGTYEWQEFAGLAIELGGYADITAIDPNTGRRFWLANAWRCAGHAGALTRAEPGIPATEVLIDASSCPMCAQVTFLGALRNLINAMEATGFLDDPHS